MNQSSKTLLHLMIGVLSLGAFALENPKSRVVYGEDNRTDLMDSTALWQEISRSTVGLVEAYRLIENNNGTYSLFTQTLGARQRLCSSERFFSQPTAPFCTGFLVALNKVLTAGHCLTTEQDCRTTRFVFDFNILDKNSQAPPQEYTRSQVASCKRILKMANDFTGKDYSLVELDRPVLDRKPLRLAHQPPEKGDPLVVIGHPNGLPTKVADQAQVWALTDTFFVSDVDTFGGNSGSPLFHEKTLEVMGILVRGEVDYVQAPGQTCRQVKVCKGSECLGEQATRIDVIRSSLELEDEF